MATSLLMGSDQTSNHDNLQTIKPLCGSEETNTEPCRSRGRRANGKGPKKQPQRGLGVAQLERLRIQESWKKMNETSAILPTLPPDHHHHLLQCHPQILPFTLHDPFGSSVPVRYGAASNHAHGTFHQCPPQVIHGNNTIAVSGQGPMVGNKSGSCSGIGGWLVPDQVKRVVSYGIGAPVWSPLLGSPLETSKELSSMPNMHSEPQRCDVCLKKKRFNEDNVKGSNARRDSTLEIWPINGPDFLGFIPQPAPNLVGETNDFCNRPAAASYATRNLDECVEVVAVHRKGNSVSGRVFMEYEFFPGKDGSGTTSKELELPTISSVAVGGEASSSIAASAYGDTASNSIDLSLKLSC